MAKKHFTQEQKLSLVEKAREIGFKEAAEIAGVHYTTVYEWQRDLQTLGREAFLNYEPKRPGRGIKEISAEQEKAILGVLETNPGYGPGQVRQQLRRQGITISMRTVRKVLEANGYKAPRKPKQVEQGQRFEATRPLELAQMDILELFINKNKIYLVLLIDDYSRFILGYRILEHTSVDGIIELVSKAVNRYGKMEELLTDRGFVFYSWRGVNRFEQYLEAQGVDHTHARPHHPQTLGKVEALNRRIQSELFKQTRFSSVEQAMSALKKWVDHYNYQRPHQGLGGFLVPAERFHGMAEKVVDDIARGCDVTQSGIEAERSLINVVLAPDGKITLYFMGQPVMEQGGRHV